MARPRNTVFAVPLLLTALLASACSQGSATNQDDGDAKNGNVKIRYFTFSAAPDHVADLDKIVAAFEADNPKIDVVVETAPYDDYFTKLQTSLAGGTAPDTFEVNYENFVTYADSGSLLALDGVAAKDGDYDPAVFADQSLAAFSRDGKQYGLPASFSTVVLIYNKDLFEAAGVDLPTADWTWEDERAAAAKLTNKKKGVFGDYQPPQFFEFYKTLNQAGGQFFNDDGSQAIFNSPEGVRAAEWLVGKVGKTMPTEADGVGTPDYDTNLFKAGKLAMWHNGIWQFDGLKDAKFAWDVVVEPGDSQKASAVFQNGAAASSTTKQPAAAWKWLRFLTSSQVTVDTRLETAWELPPVADSAALATYLEKSPPANRQAVVDSLDAIALPPVIASQQEMQDIITEELGNAAAGRKPVQKALDDAVARVNKLLG
jgi:multiple sugar transport system substrate-binding protein